MLTPGLARSGQRTQRDTARCESAVFDKDEKKAGKRHCHYSQCRSDERNPDRCAGVCSYKAWIKAFARPHGQQNPSVVTKNYYVCSKVRITSSALSNTYKRLKERFLIGRKKTKRAHFRGSPLFQATYNIKNRKNKQSIQLILCQLDVGGWRKEKNTRLTQGHFSFRQPPTPN